MFTYTRSDLEKMLMKVLDAIQWQLPVEVLEYDTIPRSSFFSLYVSVPAPTTHRLLEDVSEKIKPIETYLKKQIALSRSDYIDNRGYAKALETSVKTLDERMTIVLQKCLKDYKAVRSLSNILTHLQMLKIFINTFKSFLKDMQDNLDMIDAILDKERFDEFVKIIPEQFIMIKEVHGKVFLNGSASSQARSLQVINTCEMCVVHIEKLKGEIGARWAKRTDVGVAGENDLKSILWHPENHQTTEGLTKAIMDLVVQYITLFRLSVANEKVLDFFNEHDSEYCFEGAMSKLDEWAVSQGFLNKEDALSIVHASSGKNYLEKTEAWMLKNPGGTAEEFLAVPELFDEIGQYVTYRHGHFSENADYTNAEFVNAHTADIGDTEKRSRINALVFAFFIKNDIIFPENTVADSAKPTNHSNKM